MLYNLLYPLSDEIAVFNVFRYITFRSVCAMLTALVLTIFVGPIFIRWLKQIKFGQEIHEDVENHKHKAGTPTMGGLLIGFGVLVSMLLWADMTNVYIWLCLLVFVGFGAIGFIDDWQKIRCHRNKGLSARVKLTLQILVATAVVIFLIQQPAYDTHLSVPFFKGIRPDFGYFYVLFAVLVIVGASNGVNLTDGLDGLAIGSSIVVTACFTIFIYATGHVNIAKYLQIIPISGIGEATIFCGALIGAGLGFLWYNAYPAQIFMGDVGSLPIGASLGFMAVLCKNELLLVVVGGLFVVETLSVILQVGYFRMSGGKRIFRMAPLHHHFELKGIPESKIIIRCWILSILLALVALSTLKLR